MDPPTRRLVGGGMLALALVAYVFANALGDWTEVSTRASVSGRSPSSMVYGDAEIPAWQIASVLAVAGGGLALLVVPSGTPGHEPGCGFLNGA
jgi:hypothetical protein